MRIIEIIKPIFQAMLYSLGGIKRSFFEDRAFRQEIYLFAIFFPLILMLGFTSAEKGILILNMFIILMAELLNTAIETICDRISKEHNDLIGKAKDCASASVFLALVCFKILFTLFLFN